jgi:hypothetical protein
MTDRQEQQAREHAEKYDRIAEWLGRAAVESLIPFSDDRVSAALAAGDAHLNTLSLASWDGRHGQERARKVCSCCKQVLPPEERAPGVLDLVRAAIRRARATDTVPLLTAWSLSDTVCVLKRAAVRRAKGK